MFKIIDLSVRGVIIGKLSISFEGEVLDLPSKNELLMNENERQKWAAVASEITYPLRDYIIEILSNI